MRRDQDTGRKRGERSRDDQVRRREPAGQERALCAARDDPFVSGIDVLPSARSVYYIFKGAALINVVAGIAENRAWPDWKDASPVTNMHIPSRSRR